MLNVVAHDRAGFRAAGDLHEPGFQEGGSQAGIDEGVGGALFFRLDWVAFEDGRAVRGGVIHKRRINLVLRSRR